MLHILLAILATGALLYVFGVVAGIVIIFSYDIFSERRHKDEDKTDES